MLIAFLGEQYWFIPPTHSLTIVGTAEIAGTIVYFLVSLIIIIFAETNRRVLAKLVITAEKLREAGEDLERRVRERTSELQQKNIELLNQAEVVRQLSGRLLQMQDEERRSLARDLHDSVGQIIAAMSINLSSVERESGQLSTKAAAALAENLKLVQELSRQIRTMSYLLHPPLLDEVGLACALDWYVKGFAERSNIQVSLDLPADFGRLSPEMETAVFRIVQECLTNVHRHSGSPTVGIRIANVENQLRVEVQDAGKGISPEKQSELAYVGSTGVGMGGMRERLRQFGGQLEINSAPGLTVVVATLPISQTRAA
jgi:signal transduction histidine kinase